jgi:hypothetical protein
VIGFIIGFVVGLAAGLTAWGVWLSRIKVFG